MSFHSIEYAVSESQWERDEDWAACSGCNGRFTKSNRRHHCRRCGGVVCGSCSKNNKMLPGFGSSQRVCDKCCKEMKRLSSFLEEHMHTLTNNFEVLKGYIPLRVYGRGPDYETEVWVSGDLLAVVYKNESEKMQVLPVALLSQVSEGIMGSSTFRDRAKGSAGCPCLGGGDSKFASKAQLLFTLHFSDGRTLDLEAPDAKSRTLMIKRYRALLEAVVPVAKYHSSRERLDERMLIRDEQDRIRDIQRQGRMNRQSAAKFKQRAENRDKLRAKYGIAKKDYTRM